ncbi:MAG: dephospho-CoA kinase [bacterium]
MSGRLVRVGLGGLIASGKSSLAAALVASAELQESIGGAVEHLDVDALLRAARSSEPSLRDAILTAVPDARRSDGALDTKALAARAFADPAVMRRLEELQWPVVRAALSEASRVAEERGVRLLLVEAIALGRSGLAEVLAGVLYLQVDEAVRRQRFVTRGGSADDFEMRNAAQAAIPAEMARIEAVPIEGSGSLPETVHAASLVLRRLCLQGESID